MKKSIINRITSLLLMFLLSFTLVSCSSLVVDDNTRVEDSLTNEGQEESSGVEGHTGQGNSKDIELESQSQLDEDGYYTSKEDVSLYIHTYKKLPKNFITKAKARDLGWEANEGNLWEVTDKKSIGGDRFGNREGLLPDKEGRHYYECDINYEGGYRGSERLVYSNDGLIYYTPDHYESFELLYGDE